MPRGQVNVQGVSLDTAFSFTKFNAFADSVVLTFRVSLASNQPGLTSFPRAKLLSFVSRIINSSARQRSPGKQYPQAPFTYLTVNQPSIYLFCFPPRFTLRNWFMGLSGQTGLKSVGQTDRLTIQLRAVAGCSEFFSFYVAAVSILNPGWMFSHGGVTVANFTQLCPVRQCDRCTCLP